MVHQTINGEQFDPARAIAETHLGDIEIWHLLNHSFRESHKVSHPVHLHLVAFRILERNGKPVAPHESGLKDTVALNIGDEVQMITKFEGYKGRYAFLCHNLEHEDRGMMARFDVA